MTVGVLNLHASSVAGDCGAGVKRQKLNHMFQRYASLQVLEMGIQNLQPCCNPSDNELLLLTNFPSITYYRLCSLPSNNCYHTLKHFFGQKYLSAYSYRKDYLGYYHCL